MNSEIARWEPLNRHQHQNDGNWPHLHPAPAAIEQAQLPKPHKTRTTPVTTRTKITRHGSQPRPSPQRPTSSGGEIMLPYRGVTRRADSYSQPTPLEEFRKLRRWPPNYFRLDGELNQKQADDLICAGASTFKGYWDEITNAPPGYNRYYAVMSSEHQGRTDRATFKHAAYKDISLNLTGAAESQFPWLSLDQPCMGYAFGKSAGTITFNYWVSKAGSSDPPTKFAGEVKPRKLKLLQILDRLQQLESGLDENPDELYRYLYSTLIEDPDRYSTKAHFGMEQQISDLIAVLTHPMWIDFSNPKNQVVAKFFDSPDQQKKQEFLHQLLLSVELYLRIHSNKHSEKAKRKLMLQLPPPIAWNLAVAQRWLEHMTVTKSRTSPGQSTFSFDMKSKKRQKDALHHFAEVLKWPNMDEIEYVLEELDRHEKPLEDRSADAMSWFSGLVLPGRTLPWLIMNSLIDCDRDTGDALKYLTHMQPATGFQYRANTYWSSQSIVGKVLGAARGVQQIAGWIGPCIYTPDLKRTECVRLRQYQSLDPRLLPKDVESMDIRTNPLGPEDVAYPIADYEVPIPDTEDVTDLIRMEKLSFVPTKEQPTSRQGPGAPLLFDAAIWFACGGESWPMKLKYDVEFINAFPCHQGPHVLFYDFQYTAIKIDSGLVDIHDWATQSGLSPHRLPSLRSSPPSKKASSALTLLSSPNAPHSSDPNDPESSSPDELAHMQVKKVLTIEALGVSDNEVFARAWCADRGHSAVVANVNQTCMACAIREAYAACVSVVILTEGGKAKEKDDDVGVLLDDDDD